MAEEKRIQAGNEGEELVPGVTENLSSALHAYGDSADPNAKLREEGAGVDQTGRPAAFDRDTGEVTGSGSNAGGGGTPGEDFDSDSAGGSQTPPMQPGR